MVFDVPASMDTYIGHFNSTAIPIVPENNHSFIDFLAPAGLTNPSIDSISQPTSYAMVSSPSKTSQLHLKDSGHGSCPLMSYQSHNTFEAATNNMPFDDGLVTGSFLGAIASNVDLSRSSLTTLLQAPSSAQDHGSRYTSQDGALAELYSEVCYCDACFSAKSR
jgi:hypothetical protein